MPSILPLISLTEYLLPFWTINNFLNFYSIRNQIIQSWACLVVLIFPFWDHTIITILSIELADVYFLATTHSTKAICLSTLQEECILIIIRSLMSHVFLMSQELIFPQLMPHMLLHVHNVFLLLLLLRLNFSLLLSFNLIYHILNLQQQ